MRPSLVVVAVVLSGCALTSHATKRSTLGVSSGSSAMLAVLDQRGPLTVETVTSADWAVPRSGLINLDHDEARAAGLTDGDEPIQVYFHVVRHPEHGTFIVDSGVEKALRDDASSAAMGVFVRRFMHAEKLKVHVPLADWVASAPKLGGVFLTHLHVDHVAGLPDVPRGTPLYAGPGEAAEEAARNLVLRGTMDRELAGHEAISEWGFEADPDGRFAGVIDVFGDGSLWAIWAPGHTAGSTAFVARTADGPVLLTGDVCHTAWGWEHGVEPGTYTADHANNAESLRRLRALAAEHPAMSVRLGHQRLPPPRLTRAE